MDEREFEIGIQVDEDVTEDYLSETITSRGLSDTTPNNLTDPVTLTIVVAGGAFALAGLVVSLIDRYRGGVVIDRTKDPLDIRRDRDLPFGFLVIQAKDGQVTVETRETPPDTLERIVAKLVGAGKDIGTAAVQGIIETAKPNSESAEPAA
ncbi:MAG TPA: hypothetical protein VLA19_21720 [Herpetosiphonaceae bacterium]|nr:hypothetical protein [Herpetosiphonaceae bacterium]